MKNPETRSTFLGVLLPAVLLAVTVGAIGAIALDGLFEGAWIVGGVGGFVAGGVAALPVLAIYYIAIKALRIG